jgi:hypothetical protein
MGLIVISHALNLLWSHASLSPPEMPNSSSPEGAGLIIASSMQRLYDDIVAPSPGMGRHQVQKGFCELNRVKPDSRSSYQMALLRRQSGERQFRHRLQT